MSNPKYNVTTFTAKIISGRRIAIPLEDFEKLDLQEGEKVTVILYPESAREGFESLLLQASKEVAIN